MEYGKKIRCGNFELLKFTKSLRRDELRMLRKEFGGAADRLEPTKGVSYIRVSDISGMWAVEYSMFARMYGVIDSVDMNDEKQKAGLSGFIVQMYTDTNILGDSEYHQGKLELIDALLKRQQSTQTDEESDADVDAIRDEAEHYEKLTQDMDTIKDALNNG